MMEKISKMKKKIEEMLSKITVNEIERRIKEDKNEKEDIKIVKTFEIKYKNIEVKLIKNKEENEVWNIKTLELAA